MATYTFSDLLQKDCFVFSKIEIPILQRDYVQGQKADNDDEKINKTGYHFIRSIFDSLQGNKPMDMDFIYGSTNQDNAFIPLDGQQRLTTLFLLHWYFACKSFTGDALEEKLVMLSHFSYETRISSREFCIALCKMKKTFAADEIPSHYIRNEPWFFNKFNLDPSVVAMLHMLDTIHNFDIKANVTYEKLNLLNFSVLNIENFGLTEELYLKMNARGKLLTEFEKIKAELEKKSDDLKWEEGIDENDKFSFRIDRSWTDLFWKNFKPSIDEAFLNFFAEFTIIQLTLQIRNLENDEGKEIIKRIQRIAENEENISVEDFTKDSFIELKKLLDLYSSNENDTKRPAINLWDFCKKKHTLFSTICKIADGAEVTYPARGLFFAQNLYLAKTKFDTDAFTDWMRVIRNIAENSNIDSVQTFKGFLTLILELSHGCDDIYAYLSSQKVASNFAKIQVQEEIFKSKIISKKKNAKRLFYELEENPFCNGKLYFAFYCCSIDFQNNESNLNLDTFGKVKTVFDTYFSKDDISDDFRVMLFTCGNHKFYEYWWSWSYKTNTNKRCCIDSTWDLYWNFSRYENDKIFKDILKEAVLKLSDKISIEKLLSNYHCPKDMPDWEKWIIKHPKEFSKHCTGHYFGITPDNKTCYLYESYKRPNDKHDCFKIPIDGKVKK